MKSVREVITSRFLQKWLIISMIVLLFCAFSGKSVSFNSNGERSNIQDTVPAKELNKINWDNIDKLIASNGALIAKLNVNDSLIIARQDYESFAGENNKVNRNNDLFTKVEIDAEYPGGDNGWSAYLKNHLRYPKEAIEKNISGTVMVQLIVDLDGSLSEVAAIGGSFDNSLRAEAVRLVKESGKWHPAIQNFRMVRAVKLQPVIFNPGSQQKKITQITDSDSSITGKVDVQAAFPGGPSSWLHYLSKRFLYPVAAQENEIQGTVVVQFIVDKKGIVSNIEPVSGPTNGGLREAVIQLISESGKWNPATLNGLPVKSLKKQSIIFKLEADNQPKSDTTAARSDSSIARTVDIESSFPGGASAWMRYLNREFRYPEEAQRKRIQGTVVVQFIVDKEGNLSGIEAVVGPTTGGLREEVVRIIKRSGKWTPATLNGSPVKSYKKQPITFRLE